MKKIRDHLTKNVGSVNLSMLIITLIAFLAGAVLIGVIVRTASQSYPQSTSNLVDTILD